jgi:hypothetical protein
MRTGGRRTPFDRRISNGPFYRLKTDLERRPFAVYSFFREDVMRKFLLCLSLATVAALPTTSAAQLPFIQDDFAHARSEAIKRKLPIFVECWAPW